MSGSKPLAYSCSGCSNVAQLANDLAVHLDRSGMVQMSCIAGVGGRVKKLVRIAASGRPILAIDGCPLACVKNTLALHGVEPTWHLELSRLGIKKREGQECNQEHFELALRNTMETAGLVPAVFVESRKDSGDNAAAD